ncbi:hypothetical protein HJD18_09080 [Thermoleophilia bacterium SCSIO 60948]|nr:hypothetical protein HJD18_09080 [Thermoleophilia bacterium SCSIO 60948]
MDEKSSTSASMSAQNAALGLGLSGGMRSMMPAAVLALRAPGTPAAIRAGLVIAALGEVVADKTPFVPSRTDPGPLFGRVMSGAGCGWVAGGPRGSLVGGAGAAVSAVAAGGLRSALSRRLGASDFALALVEDAVAGGLALGAAAQVER